MALLQEFKTFINRGNVVDLAVAVAVGHAFNNVVETIVKSGFMPIVNLLLPKHLGWEKWSLGPIGIGKILSAGVHFLVIAFVVFMVVHKFMRRRPQPPEAASVPEDVAVLREIRDLLRQQRP